MFLRPRYEIRVQRPGSKAMLVPFSQATWSGGRQEAKRTLAVKMHQGRDRFWENSDIAEGDFIDLVSYFTEEPRVIFSGIVVDLGKTTDGDISPVAYDFGFYLLQNDVSSVHDGGPADGYLRRMFQQVGIPIGTIPAMPNVEPQVQRGKKLWDAVGDVLNQVYRTTGLRYWCWVEGESVYVGTQRAQTRQWVVQQGGILTSASRKRSIKDMRNVVIAIGTGDDETAPFVYETSDPDNVAKFGRMVKIIEAKDPKDRALAVAQADQEKQNLNRVKEEASVSGIGLDEAISGTRIEVYEEFTGLSGAYTIWSDSHTIRPDGHDMQLQLQMEEGADS